jgi:hypothetical protein
LIAGQRASATQVPLFCSGSMSHSAYLIRIIARKGGPSKLSKQTDSWIKMQRTSCRRPRAEAGVRDLANVNVKDGLFKPAREDVSSETDNVLRPDEGAHCVVHLCS